MNRTLILTLAASLGLSACSKEPAALASPAARSMAPAPMAKTANTGKVVQIQQAGSYTYAEVEVGKDQRVWIAGGHIEAKAGDTLQWGDYSVMHNFNAKSLNRIFEQIVFVNDWGPVGGAMIQVAPHGGPVGGPAAQAAPHGSLGGNAAAQVAPHGGAMAAPAAGDASGVVKSVANAGGYSYVEVAQGNDTVWVAATETPLKAGDKVSWQGGSVMQNFNAKSLGRVFERIVFASGISVVN